MAKFFDYKAELKAVQRDINLWRVVVDNLRCDLIARDIPANTEVDCTKEIEFYCRAVNLPLETFHMISDIHNESLRD